MMNRTNQYFGPRIHAGAATTILLTCTIGILLTGCAVVDTAESSRGEVEVHTTGSSVVLSNGLDERVYHFVVGRRVSALINWAPHLDDDKSAAPDKSTSVPYDDIMMDESGETQAIVYWWTASVWEGKQVPGDIESVIVDL